MLNNHFGFIAIIVFVLGVGSVLCGCNNYLYTPPTGNIYSPVLLDGVNSTNCMWHIMSREPAETIIINVIDLDIEEDGEECEHRPCCKHNWLSVPVTGSGKVKTQQLCGIDSPRKSILVQAPEVAIKYHISKVTRRTQGFRIQYGIYINCSKPGMVMCSVNPNGDCYHNVTQRCDGKVHCKNGADETSCPGCPLTCRAGYQCYTKKQRCDGRADCRDLSDEDDCSFCEKGKILCSSNSHHCYHPKTELCDGNFDCPWGEDEVNCVPGCEKKIACSSGEGCYAPSQRCDALADCADSSDESLCPAELCARMPTKRQCRNGLCIPAVLWCNGKNDCGDNSDEDACVKNLFIALTIIVSLLSILLVVVAMGCLYRIYGSRLPIPPNYHLHIPPPIASRLRMTSVTLPTLVDDNFFLREPPPAYSLAMGEVDIPVIQNVPVARPQRQRRQRPRPVPPPQVAAKPCEASSSQSSPSRSSVTSSPYLSGTDDTLLLSS